MKIDDESGLTSTREDAAATEFCNECCIYQTKPNFSTSPSKTNSIWAQGVRVVVATAFCRPVATTTVKQNLQKFTHYRKTSIIQNLISSLPFLLLTGKKFYFAAPLLFNTAISAIAKIAITTAITTSAVCSKLMEDSVPVIMFGRDEVVVGFGEIGEAVGK